MDLYIATLTKWEDPNEYQELLERLADSYQPIGVSEELEVQQIAVCWWKRSRAWRYENAAIAGPLCAKHFELSSLNFSWAVQDRLALLRKAELEIEGTGKLSEELYGKIIADAELAKLWKFVDEQLSEALARHRGVPLPAIREARDSDPDSGKNLLLGIVRGTALQFQRDNEILVAETAKLASDLEAIPRPEALDRLLRADAATERSLGRAMDRLERLQRQRREKQLLLRSLS
jgi:hypothetical protein